MNDILDDSQQRTREHLIPEYCFHQKRGMEASDFYCCEECNSAKSDMDLVFTLVSKIQPDEPFRVEDAERVLNDKKRLNKYLQFLNTAQANGETLQMEFPASKADRSKYIENLGKGFYCTQTRKTLASSRKFIHLRCGEHFSTIM